MNTTDAMKQALERIKRYVCGEASPNWDNSPATYNTRGLIADICDAALAIAEMEKE